MIQDLIFDELAEVFAAEDWTAAQLAARLVVSVQLQLGILAQAFGLPRSVQAAMETARVVSAEKLTNTDAAEWEKCGIDKVKMLFSEDDLVSKGIAETMLPLMCLASLHGEHWGELDVVRSTIELARNASRLHANAATLTAIEAIAQDNEEGE